MSRREQTISIEEAASLCGVQVIQVPPLDELGPISSPTRRLAEWVQETHGFRHPRDNIYAGDKLVARLRAAERKFQGDKKAAALVDLNSGPLEHFNGSRLTGDGLFVFPGPGVTQ